MSAIPDLCINEITADHLPVSDSNYFRPDWLWVKKTTAVQFKLLIKV